MIKWYKNLIIIYIYIYIYKQYLFLKKNIYNEIILYTIIYYNNE